MSYQIIWEPQGVHRRFHCDLTGAEVLRSLTTMTSDPRFDDMRYSIADYLDVDRYEADQESLTMLSAFHYGAHASNARIVTAAVMNKDEVREVFRRFQASYSTPFPLQIFDNLADAREWIARRIAAYGSAPRWD
jgi:hypothetical protein